MLKREIYFRDFHQKSWPSVDELAPYFLAPDAATQWGATRNDNWGLGIYGFNGTENDARRARRGSGQKQQEWAHMGMWGDPHLGVLLYYESIRNKQWTNCYSIGDPALQQKWTRTLHGDLMPAWLYISFRDAWPPVKEFMETDGELPKCINWINSRDIPPNTFPDPYPRTIVAINDDLP